MANLAKIVKRVFLHQKLVYWQRLPSGQFGKAIYAAGVEFSCRWEDKIQEIILPDGRKVLSRGYLLMTDKLVAESLVRLGSLSEWQAALTYAEQINPQPPTVARGGREILLVATTPDIKAKSEIYEVYL